MKKIICFWLLYINSAFATECTLLLNELGINNDYLDFISCSVNNNELGAPVKAIYKFKGRDVTSVEEYLNTKLKIPPVKNEIGRWVVQHSVSLSSIGEEIDVIISPVGKYEQKIYDNTYLDNCKRPTKFVTDEDRINDIKCLEYMFVYFKKYTQSNAF